MTSKLNRPFFGQRIMALASALAFILSQSLTAAQARVEVGVTAAVIPQAVMGDKPETLKTITVGEDVRQDVLIETGKRGRTQVLFVDGSSMNIGPSSRIIVDEFVFDPAQLSGNLGARIEKGSMRFIGGVLSKRADQVKFNAGKATVGIRGGIAKIAVEGDGKMLAELVHGRLSVATPEGLFETDRIGTLIERDITGAVSTRSVTSEEIKTELDEEAKENEQVSEDDAASETVGNDDGDTGDTGDTETQAAAAGDQQGEEPADEAPDATDADAAADTATGTETAAAEDASAVVEEKTGDVLVDNPVEAGLVEVDAEGNLKASQELVDIDPQAAEFIDEGALVVTDNGEIMPTEKMLEVDPTAREMFEAGYLEVDENGLLVPSTRVEEASLFISETPVEFEETVISSVTLEEFNYVEPEAITSENAFKANLSSSRETLETDTNAAKLFELGQLEIGADGALKPSERFNPLVVARSSRIDRISGGGIIEDKAADRLLLSAGAFDTKVTTRVVGVGLAREIFSDAVTQVVSAEIVRDDAIISIERLAAANQVALPEDLTERKLDELVTIGGALSTRDALKASIDAPSASLLLPELIIGDSGSDNLIDYKISEEAQIAFNLPEDEIDLTDEMIGGLISRGVTPETVISVVTDENGLAQIGLVDNAGDSGFADAELFIPTLPEEEIGNVDDFEDYGREAFVGSIGGEFIEESEDLFKSVGIESISEAIQRSIDIDDGLIVPVTEDTKETEEEDFFASDEDNKETEPAYVEPIYVAPEAEEGLVREQIEDQQEVIDQGFDFWKFNMAGQRVPVGETVFGQKPSGYVPFYLLWEAYNTSRGESDSYISRDSNNQVSIGFDADVKSYGSAANRIAATTLRPSGSVTDLLAFDNFALQAAVKVLSGYARSTHITNEPEMQQIKFTADNSLAMARQARLVNPSVTICECDQMATGIWKSDSFTNESLDNITYQHKGHWAIGQPLSSDTLRSLAGMSMTFTGHAVGTVVTPTLDETGYGSVVMKLDFANPASGTANNFKLNDFRSPNYELPDSPYFQLELDTKTGNFSGSNWRDDTVDGALYGDVRNLQAGGTFAVSRSTTSANEVSISGTFAAKATSISK